MDGVLAFRRRVDGIFEIASLAGDGAAGGDGDERSVCGSVSRRSPSELAVFRRLTGRAGLGFCSHGSVRGMAAERHRWVSLATTWFRSGRADGMPAPLPRCPKTRRELALSARHGAVR